MEKLRRSFRSHNFELVRSWRFLAARLIQGIICQEESQIELLNPKTSIELGISSTSHYPLSSREDLELPIFSRAWILFLCMAFLGTVVFLQTNSQESSSKLGSAGGWFWYAISTTLVNAVVRSCTKREKSSRRMWLTYECWGMRAFTTGLIFGVGQVLGHFATDAYAIRWWQALLPLIAYQANLLPSRYSFVKNFEFINVRRQGAALGFATLASLATLSPIYLSPSESFFGISSIVLTAVSIVEFQRILEGALLEMAEIEPSKLREGLTHDEDQSSLIFERNCTADRLCEHCLIRHFACGVAIPLTILILIPKIQFAAAFNRLLTPPITQLVNQSLKFQLFVGIISQVQLYLLFQVVKRLTAVVALLVFVSGLLMSHLYGGLQPGYIFGFAVFGIACADKTLLGNWIRISRGIKWRLMVHATVTIILLTCLLLTYTQSMTGLSIKDTIWTLRGLNGNPKSEISQSLPQSNSSQTHPMQHLIVEQQKRFLSTLNNQSKSLDEAVLEYRHRYSIPPPPKFHIWYEYAKTHDVQLIDEFDSLHQMLTPFWALDPKTLRSRVKEALGFKENNLLAVLIRDGSISFVQEGNSTEIGWMRDAITNMLSDFVHHLPDMDLAFNLHDEPRIILPNDQLTRLLNGATSKIMALASSNSRLQYSFSHRPSDMNSGRAIEDVRVSRFNRFSRQNSWSHSRISCPLDSAARSIGDSATDDTNAWAYGNLSFVKNATEFTDICSSPSLQNSHGFFERPNVFNIAQDLIPIFSQSKVSSFQDILYPSPWYWARKVKYDSNTDVPFEKKNSSIYWRGSTTGGYSRKGGWRRQHRQSIVRALNNPETSAKVLVQDVNQNDTWQETPLQNGVSSPSRLIDVAFTHIGQCDLSDCAAQQEFFEVREQEPQWNAWRSKLALDMDGNAFSGRFHALLSSSSAVAKMAVFREWWSDWIWPWVHYVPLSVQGNEWWEVIRWFLDDEEGLKAAEAVGMAGKQWSSASFRKEDMQAWMFRLLLEYGRLIDDNREAIGFSGA